MNAENEDLLAELKPIHQTTSSSLLRTLLSLVLFIAVDYWIFKSWSSVFVMVSVIFLHEMGHFIAMKIFGYKAINMTFVPFLGAYVSGEATHFSKYKKIVMLLAGPVPGIVIGMVILFLYHQNSNEYYYLASLAFLLLNLFNLLPVSPLDGGQFIETFFFNSNLVIQLIFLFISLVILFYALYMFRSWFLIVVVWFVAMRIRSAYLTYKVRKELDKRNIFYNCSYDDLSDEHYAQIRDVLVTQSSSLGRKFSPGEHSSMEGELVSFIEKILTPPYDHNLNTRQKIVCIVIYLLAFILPLLEWAHFKY